MATVTTPSSYEEQWVPGSFRGRGSIISGTACTSTGPRGGRSSRPPHGVATGQLPPTRGQYQSVDDPPTNGMIHSFSPPHKSKISHTKNSNRDAKIAKTTVLVCSCSSASARIKCLTAGSKIGQTSSIAW